MAHHFMMCGMYSDPTPRALRTLHFPDRTFPKPNRRYLDLASEFEEASRGSGIAVSAATPVPGTVM